ncbi:N-acetylmannosamine-6-phosphate 2-epimerase [Paenibacillus beijingensis]|uniref:Putative N-acetylmannosamine-6-phosphate 2-epimerase n=2 Tax=Paenibacillus beijingensis TaxID=1126833 RepID=A0A0D5NGM6_9BACL|nr:N-acetylmannosamine-6-phosphate 2-epimerase [Paenibacillus beijingensis]AJY74073.1 N-acetylmannosamine-6-phosphate 2-epimerase [Paenibacillus beijingensis]
MNLFEKVRHGVVVSCQALPDEPLHGSEIMARMAKAAEEGGAVAIRANTKEDVRSIKQAVSLPVIGIVKRNYDGFDVYITPTTKEVDELIEAGADMIAFDATRRNRPNGCTLENLVGYMKARGALAMADVSTMEEALYAQQLGVDCVSTTLSGYTPYSRQNGGPDFRLVEQAAGVLNVPLFAEGRISEPQQVALLLAMGAHSVVVGSAITRPQLITRRFTSAAKRRTSADESEVTN